MRTVGLIIRHVVVAVVAIAAFAVVASFNMVVGVALMLAYSGWTIVRACRHDLPLNGFTCLLPAVMSLVCLGLQVAVFPPLTGSYVLVGGVAGIGLGIFLGRSHRVFIQQRTVYARSTSAYAAIWVLAHGATQILGLLDAGDIFDPAFGLNSLASLAMATLHVALLWRSGFFRGRAARLRRSPASATVSFVVTLVLLMPMLGVAPAFALYPVKSAREAVSLALQPRDFGRYAEMREIPWRDVLAAQPGGTALTALGPGSRIDTAANAYRTQVGPNLWLYSGLALTYARPTTGIARDIQYAVTGVAARTTVNLVQAARRVDPNLKQFNAQVIDCGTHCIEIITECHYLAIKNHNDWDIVLSLALTTRAPVFGAEPEDPLPATCLPHGIPNAGRRLVQLVEQRLAQMDYQGSVSSGTPGDPASTAAVLAALLQVLAGIGMIGARAVAQSAALAAASQIAASTGRIGATGAIPVVAGSGSSALAHVDAAAATPPTTPVGTRILDGDAAVAWLKNNDYLTPDGRRGDKFISFMQSMPSEAAPGLQAFAGDLDSRGNPFGHFAIVVTDEAPPPFIESPPPAEPAPTTEPPAAPEPPEPGPPEATGPSMIELRDRWRAQARELEQRIDHKRQRMEVLKDQLHKLEHEYNIARYAACSDAVIDCIDLFAGTVLDKLQSKTVSGAWWKELIKGTLKDGIRQLIGYTQTGELKSPDLLQRVIDSYGVKTNAPPGGAFKQFLQNTMEKSDRLKPAGNLLGVGEEVTAIYTNTVDNMQKTARLRSQINTYASEHRELERDVGMLQDDYQGKKSSADRIDGDIARMSRPRRTT